MDEVGAGAGAGVGGVWKADAEPDAGALAILLDDVEDGAGLLAAGDARDLDDHVNAGSWKWLGTMPGVHVRNQDHAAGISINHFILLPSGKCAKSANHNSASRVSRSMVLAPFPLLRPQTPCLGLSVWFPTKCLSLAPHDLCLHS